MAQCEVLGLKFPRDCKKISHNLSKLIDITIPCNRILKSEEDKNHSRVKNALLSLTKKVIEYEDNKVWMALNIVAFPKITKYENTFSFTIHPLIWDCILNFSKGYRKIELKIVKDFISEYSMRFYELMSGQNTPITFTIDQIKSMFKLENKYKDTNRFISKVIDVAQKELDEKSPYSFDYKINKQGRKFHSITFYPKQIGKNQDPEIFFNRAKNLLPASSFLSKEEINYLMTVYAFSESEIQQHIETFTEAKKRLDLLDKLSYIKRYATNARNPKGYVINALRQDISELKEKDSIKI